MRKIIWMSIFLLIIHNLSLAQDNILKIQKDIIGTWYYFGETDTILQVEFKEDNEIETTNMVFPLINEGYLDSRLGKWIDKEWFKLELKDEQLCLNIYTEDDELLMENHLFYFSNYMVQVGIKWWLKDSLSHYDEITLLKRENIAVKPLRRPVKYIFQEDFLGEAYIVYNEKQGVDECIDDMGSRVLEIPEDGILQVNFDSDPVSVATSNQEFYIRTNNGKLKKINLNLYNQNDAEELKVINKINEGEYYVKSRGFNQQGRNSLNKKLGIKLKGNVEFLTLLKRE